MLEAMEALCRDVRMRVCACMRPRAPLSVLVSLHAYVSAPQTEDCISLMQQVRMLMPLHPQHHTQNHHLWRLQEADRCAALLSRQVRAAHAASQALGPIVQACAIALAHMQGLQGSHSLALAPRLLRRLWPTVTEVRRAGLESVG